MALQIAIKVSVFKSSTIGLMELISPKPNGFKKYLFIIGGRKLNN
jgi:hypothetical protein